MSPKGSPHDAALSFTREISMEYVQDENRPVERLIRIGEVKRLTGVSTATLYRKIAAKEFPRPVRLGVAARAWPLSEVQDWIAGRIAVREHRGHGDNGAGKNRAISNAGA
jgi:prophage regulatory protein